MKIYSNNSSNLNKINLKWYWIDSKNELRAKENFAEATYRNIIHINITNFSMNRFITH